MSDKNIVIEKSLCVAGVYALLCYVYTTKLSQICIDLHTADESTPAFCEVPGGLQEAGAVSRSPPLWRATSLGMTNNVHQRGSSYCFHFYSALSLLL